MLKVVPMRIMQKMKKTKKVVHNKSAARPNDNLKKRFKGEIWEDKSVFKLNHISTYWRVMCLRLNKKMYVLLPASKTFCFVQ